MWYLLATAMFSVVMCSSQCDNYVNGVGNGASIFFMQ